MLGRKSLSKERFLGSLTSRHRRPLFTLLSRFQYFYFYKLVEQRRLLRSIKGQSVRLILDIGCGHGETIEYLSSRGVFCVGIDVDNRALKLAHRLLHGRNNVELVVADARSIPIRDKSAEFVYSLSVIEHVFDDELALSEMMRLISDRNCGKLFLTADSLLYDSLQDDISRRYSILHTYSLQKLRQMMEKTGSEIKQAEYVLHNPISRIVYKMLLSKLRLLGVILFPFVLLVSLLFDRPSEESIGYEIIVEAVARAS